MELIRRNEAEIHAIPDPFHSQTVAAPMQMTVETPPHIITLQKLQNFGTLITLVLGWIV